MRTLEARCLYAVLTALLASLLFAASSYASTGAISGRVTAAAGGAPIEGIEVCATLVEGVTEEETCVMTDPNGEYRISGLPAGEYYVGFFPPFEGTLDYQPQIYGETVTVTSGGTASGVNAALLEGGIISGTVTRAAAGKAPIEGIGVCAWGLTSEAYPGCSQTNSKGEYTIVGLSAGEYEVAFFAIQGSGLDYIPQFYDQKELSSEATHVPVTVGSTTSSIDAEMDEGGGISGTVTDSSTRQPLKALVCAIKGKKEECVLTNSAGEYEMLGLAAGDYEVEFISLGYATQYYDDKSSFSEAQPVEVVTGSIQGNIDAAMLESSFSPPPPVETVPSNTTAPSVQGTPSVGSTLICVEGLWTGTPTLSVQWLRDGAPIPGATSSTYVVTSTDAGHALACQVTASNRVGGKIAISAGLAVPAPPSVTSTGQIPAVTVNGSHFTVAGKKVKVDISCANAACKGAAQITLNAIVKVHKGKRLVKRKETIALAKGSFSLAAGKQATISLTLTSAGRTRAKHLKRHPLSVRLVLSVSGGSQVNKHVRLS